MRLNQKVQNMDATTVTKYYRNDLLNFFVVPFNAQNKDYTIQ